MNLTEIFKKSQKLMIDNSPAILTALGVTGAITTAYLSGKASFEASKIIEEETYIKNVKRLAAEPKIELTAREKADLVWKLYIPAVGLGVLTVSAIIASNRIGARRAAAIATAFSIAERGYDEYKTKVIEKIGEKKERQVRDEIAQDRVNRKPPNEATPIIIGEGNILVCEQYTGRYFTHLNVEKLKKAQNDLNYKVINNFYATLSEFYDLLDIPHTSISDEIGWSTEDLLELEFHPVLTPKGEPCLSFTFRMAPVRENVDS